MTEIYKCYKEFCQKLTLKNTERKRFYYTAPSVSMKSHRFSVTESKVTLFPGLHKIS